MCKQTEISLCIVFNKGDRTTLHLRELRINFSSVDNFVFIKSSRNDFAGLLFGKDFRAAAERLALDVFLPRHERLFLHAPRVFFGDLLCLLLFGARAQMVLRFSLQSPMLYVSLHCWMSCTMTYKIGVDVVLLQMKFQLIY